MGDTENVDKNILLEQYKLYVEMADRISQRRQSANTYFLSVNTLLLSFFAFMSSGKPSLYLAFIAIALAGWSLCFVWFRLIKSYKGLNSGKFKVIHDMERLLGYSPYDMEWEKVGRGKNKNLYQPFTDIEPDVPKIFAGLYLLSILLTLPWKNLIDYFCS